MLAYLLKTLKLVMFIATSAFFFAMIFRILYVLENDIWGEEYVLNPEWKGQSVGFFEN